MLATVPAEHSMPSAAMNASESASVTPVKMDSRPTCAGVTSAAP